MNDKDLEEIGKALDRAIADPRTVNIVMDSIGEVAKIFHLHLSQCAQCRNHPFNLCPFGARIINSLGKK